MKFIMTFMFVLFMAFLVIGFNKQMIEKNKKSKQNRMKNEDIN
ncbi:hypothetical protein [Campylobacter portucalensis]|nr:hypothetical protein [Campylobacter portucalensis]